MKFSKKILSLTLVALMAFTTACGGSSTSTDGASTPDAKTTDEVKSDRFQSRPIKFLSIWSEDQDNAKILLELSEEYAKTVDGFELELEYISAKDVNSKVSVLLNGDNLPDVFAYEAGTPLIPLIDAGKVVNIEEAFTELGIMDKIEPGAVSLLENLVDDKGLYDLPLGMNIEGFWYNKEAFAKAGIEKEPETFEEFIDACDKLMAAGIQPIAVGGKDEWPLTRLLNAIVFRSIGLDAVSEAMEGTRSFTDPEFVEAARTLQEMAEKGYLGVGANTVDNGTANSMLISGQAGMQYDGSWITQQLTNPEVNTAGDDGIGFFNVPLINDTSTLTDFSMNCGNILVLSADKYDEQVAHWAEYVFSRIGDYSMQEYGTYKGYKVTEIPDDLSPYTKLVGDELQTVTGSTLWFEAKMDQPTSKKAKENITVLVTGEMTPEDYMEALETSAEAYRKSK